MVLDFYNLDKKYKIELEYYPENINIYAPTRAAKWPRAAYTSKWGSPILLELSAKSRVIPRTITACMTIPTRFIYNQ